MEGNGLIKKRLWLAVLLVFFLIINACSALEVNEEVKRDKKNMNENEESLTREQAMVEKMKEKGRANGVPEEFLEDFFDKWSDFEPSINVQDSDRHSFDEEGNLIIDVEEIINEWGGHPFHVSNEELLAEGTKYANEIVELYKRGEIEIYKFVDDAIFLVDEFNDYFFDGQFNITGVAATSTILISDDLRMGLLALEYSKVPDPEYLHELIAIDHHHQQEFVDLSPEEVSQYIIDFFSENQLDQIKVENQ